MKISLVVMSLAALSVASLAQKPNLRKQLMGPDWQKLPRIILAQREKGMVQLEESEHLGELRPDGSFVRLANLTDDQKGLLRDRIGKVVVAMGEPGADILAKMLVSDKRAYFVAGANLLNYEGAAAIPVLCERVPKLKFWPLYNTIDPLIQVANNVDPSHLDPRIARAFLNAIGRPGEDGNGVAGELGLLPVVELLPFFYSALDSFNETVRLNAARGLVREGVELKHENRGEGLETCVLLAKHLGDPSMAVRRVIAGGIELVQIPRENRQEVSQALQKAAASSDKRLRLKARDAGRKLGFLWAKS